MLAIVIPCYKAQKTLKELLTSIRLQREVDYHIYLSIDDDSSYEEFKSDDVTIIPFTKNEGPGVARNKGLDLVTEDFVTFIDADDVLYEPYSLYKLLEPFSNPHCIETLGVFLSPHKIGGGAIRFMPRGGSNDPWHPWCFGRVYRTAFLKEMGIKFHNIRSMEDSYMVQCTKMLIEGTNLTISAIDEPVYIWSEGSEHSITRTKAEGNDIPTYNFGTCQIGAAIAYKSAIEFVEKKNPYNPNIKRTAVEMMVSHFFTEEEAREQYPEFYDLNREISKWWFLNVYKRFEVDYDILEKTFLVQFKAKQLTKFPHLTFEQWWNEIKETKSADIDRVFQQLPQPILDSYKNSCVYQSFNI